MQPILLHHCVVPAALDPHQIDRWMALLPPGKAGRLARLREPSLRAASLLGIALLHDCARAAGLAPPPPGALHFPETGKPAWVSGPDFSISHAAHHVACAMAPAGVEVGLDIETAGAAERAGLSLLSDDVERAAAAGIALTATDLWTAREAVAKLAGTGIMGVAAVSLTATGAHYLERDYVLVRPWLGPGIHCTLACSETRPVLLREAQVADLSG